ncbi:PREDICTED: thylakoid lumenal 16.5 kDa protein, chloroplastic-like [Populus euphratica]|uniref:Thylakoid lumenal 16.5 kDa protein, chloroplastic-like n=1 Tax=Populus euphratica TaxID=75702 RepID=A0AAJ6TZY5_POPEU|nr:PREDICTED: thylakoid lumenal 16.5 kDa protein, chloroplastic-like [Populus euphratica]
MATAFLLTAKPFLSSSSTPSSLSSLTNTPVLLSCAQQKKCNATRSLTLCKTLSDETPPVTPSPVIITKRSLSICFLTSFVFSLASRGNSSTNAAILEADDDEELMEKVKRDRKKRLEKQGVISSANQEKGYLQDLVYKLSKVGQAIDKNDLSTASSVLGGSTDTDWVRKANIAFTKLSSSPDEKTQVDTFNSSLASLISSVTGNDIESSKTAFVSSATAFEKWTALTGLVGQLKGL